MTAAENTSETDSQQVGKVVILYETAKAVSADGTERLLAAESPIFANDRIITEGEGRVSIVIDDDVQTQIDLEGKNEILIDEDIFGGAGSTEIAEAAAESEEVQEAFFIQDIDLTAEPETNTTDSVSDAGGGREIADFDRITHEGDISKTAGEKFSVIFDENDYTDIDNNGLDDPLDNLLDTDDSSS